MNPSVKCTGFGLALKKFFRGTHSSRGPFPLYMLRVSLHMRRKFIFFGCQKMTKSSNMAPGPEKCDICTNVRWLAVSLQYTVSSTSHIRGIGMPSPFPKLELLLQSFSKRTMRDIINKFVYMFDCCWVLGFFFLLLCKNITFHSHPLLFYLHG